MVAHQAAAGLIDTADGETFELSSEAAEVLADEEGSLWFTAGAFQGGVAAPEVVDRLADSSEPRPGGGLTYDDLGPSAAHGVERMLAPWTRLALVPRDPSGSRGALRRGSINGIPGRRHRLWLPVPRS